MKKLLVAIGFVMAGTILTSSPVHAQAQGSTDVDINFPSIVILHYYGNIDVQLTSTALGNFLAGTPGNSGRDEGTAAPAAGGFTQDMAITPTFAGGNDPSSAILTLENAYHVRGITIGGGTGNISVDINTTSATLTHANGAGSGTIDINGSSVQNTALGLGPASSIDYPSPGLGGEPGDIVLDLDLSNANEAGWYNDGVVLLQATAS